MWEHREVYFPPQFNVSLWFTHSSDLRGVLVLVLYRGVTLDCPWYMPSC